MLKETGTHTKYLNYSLGVAGAEQKPKTSEGLKSSQMTEYRFL